MTASVPAPRFVTATQVFIRELRSDIAFRLDHSTLTPVSLESVPRGAIAAHIPGTVLPGFTDSHVHLALIDGGLLGAGGIANVVDLGWDPRTVQKWKQRGESSDPGDSVGVEFVGAFLTAAGGYPLHSDWAPKESVRQIRTADDAKLVVAQMVALGASAIKITLNSAVGPVFTDELLMVLVGVIHGHHLPVVVHAEGAGQAMRALRAGADRFAHTPFSERLTDDDVALMAQQCAWISTLDIHGWGEPDDAFHIASDNLARFAAAGGAVLYGTDLGNGPLPVGINVRELGALAAAGLSHEKLTTALVPNKLFRSRISCIADTAKSTDHALWLASAEVVAVDSLEKRFA